MIRRLGTVAARRQRVRGLFSERQQTVRAEERAWLATLPGLLSEAGANELEHAAVVAAARQLDELFLVVVVGEFNSGKSSLINALLGQRLLKEGVTPTTSHVNIVKYGGDNVDGGGVSDAEYASQGITVVRYSGKGAEWLREINIVDTPGTNAIFTEHQMLTEEFLPRSDLVMFVTSADRPFSASEREILELIEGWKRKMVLVINKAELLETAEELKQVEEFVREHLRELGTNNQISVPQFSVAAREVLRGRSSPGFEALQNYVLRHLSAGERAELKLRGPLEAAHRALRGATSRVSERRERLLTDKRRLDGLAAEETAWRKSMNDGLKGQQAALANILLRLESRGLSFLDSTVAIRNLPELVMGRETTRARFEKTVVGDLGAEVERQLAATVEWLVSGAAQQIETQTGRLTSALRESEGKESFSVAGESLSAWETERAVLAETVKASGRAAVDGIKASETSQQLASTLRDAGLQVAALELGAIGLAGVLGTALLDITGLLGASAVAGLGLAVLPYRRAQQKKALRTLLSDLRSRLHDDLAAHADRHVTATAAHLAATRQPYALYVDTSAQQLSSVRERLLAATAECDRLHAAIDKM